MAQSDGNQTSTVREKRMAQLEAARAEVEKRYPLKAGEEAEVSVMLDSTGVRLQWHRFSDKLRSQRQSG